VNFTLAPNVTGAARIGTLTAGGKVLTVTQAAELPPSQPQGIRIIVK
jgi:hypothetical protein